MPSVIMEGGDCDVCSCWKLLKSGLREATFIIWQATVIHSLQVAIQDEFTRQGLYIRDCIIGINILNNSLEYYQKLIEYKIVRNFSSKCLQGIEDILHF